MSFNDSPEQQADLFEQAFALHEGGLLSEAAAAYEKLLVEFPGDTELLAGLGTVALQQGRFAEAVELLGCSLAGDPAQACILTNRGLAYAQLQQPVEALACYDLAIAVDPVYVDAFFNRGNLLKDLRRLEEAVGCYDAALVLYPEFAGALSNRGAALLELRQYAAALESFQRALRFCPDDALIHNNCGIALQGLQRLQEAVLCFDKALALNPRLAEVFNNRGSALMVLNCFDQALLDFDEGLALNPALAEIHKNRAKVLQALERHADALLSYEQAIVLDAANADLFVQRGHAFRALLRFEEAVESYGLAIGLDPDCANFYIERAHALDQCQRWEEAMLDFSQAIALNPLSEVAHWGLAVVKILRGCHAEAIALLDLVIELNPAIADVYVDRGNALKDLQRLDAARVDFDRAIALDPMCSKAYWSKAALAVLRGDYAEGWPLFEWRWAYKQKAKRRGFSEALWLGDVDIAGKTVLIHPEQGLGDFIQFCRYVPLLGALGAQVVLETPAVLFALMSGLPGCQTLVRQGAALPVFDVHCPVMSLPLAFDTRLDNLPDVVPYLFADAAKSRFWQARLGEKSRLRVGLVWSGSSGHQNDRNRSIPLAVLEPLWRLPVDFHALQIEFRPGDAALLAGIEPLQCHAEQLRDFADTAALLDNLDLVICVDTSVAHLAGAMGKPVWILLPFAPDYRWLLARADCPWYPSAKLFRQPVYGDWHSVVAAVAEDLQLLPVGGVADGREV